MPPQRLGPVPRLEKTRPPRGRRGAFEGVRPMKKTLPLLLLAACLPLAAGDLHGKVTCKGASDCTGAVVYLGAIAGKTFPAPKEHPKVDQKNLLFVPHILAVQQ